MVLALADGSVGTGAATGTTAGPDGMAPNHLVTFCFAVARSMSPDSTRMALLGP